MFFFFTEESTVSMPKVKLDPSPSKHYEEDFPHGIKKDEKKDFRSKDKIISPSLSPRSKSP